MMRTTIVLLFLLTLTAATFIPPSQASLECITCVATVKGVEAKVLAEGGDIAKKDVNAICLKEVPTHAAEKLCEKYGDEEVDLILTLIKEDVPPKKICEELKKC